MATTEAKATDPGLGVVPVAVAVPFLVRLVVVDTECLQMAVMEVRGQRSPTTTCPPTTPAGVVADRTVATWRLVEPTPVLVMVEPTPEAFRAHRLVALMPQPTVAVAGVAGVVLLVVVPVALGS